MGRQRLSARLSARRVETIRKPGTYADGGNLYLRVQARNGRVSKSWVFRWARDGKVFERGLGAVDVRSLAEARQVAAELRKALFHGQSPDELLQRRRRKNKTFSECALELIESKRPGWKTKNKVRQWTQTLRDYAFPVLGNKAPAEVTTNDVLAVLKPIWTTKPSTAQYVRDRIAAVLDYAAVIGLRQKGDNPAQWKGKLELALPSPRKVRPVVHFAAADWKEVPALYSCLSEKPGIPSLCLQFIILTAVRSNEARGASWQEIDLNDAVWTIPAQRMKNGRTHKIPLSPVAVDLLMSVQPWSSDSLIFPGAPKGTMSGATLLKLLRTVAPGATVHGFRSSFRVWAEEHGYASSVAEAALAHTNTNATEAAYQRSDLFARRRELMDAWAAFVTGHATQRLAAAAGGGSHGQ